MAVERVVQGNFFEHLIFDGRRRSVFEPGSPETKASLRALHGRVSTFLEGLPEFKFLYESGAVHGFVKGRDYISHAKRHKDARRILTTDVFRAFESVTREKVISLLEKYGASEDLVKDVSDMAFLFGKLPAGYPSSPSLFNVAMLDVDIALVEYAARNGLVYSRYADDMAFSTKGEYISQEVIDGIFRLVAVCGYDLHKTHPKDTSREPVKICGVGIQRGRLVIPGREKRRMRAVAYQALAKGDQEAVARINAIVARAKRIEGKVPSGLSRYAYMAKEMKRRNRRNKRKK